MRFLFADVVEKLQPYKSLYGELTVEQFNLFVEITTRFLPYILSQGQRIAGEPPSLPEAVLESLVRSVGLSVDLTRDLWSACGSDVVEANDATVLRSVLSTLDATLSQPILLLGAEVMAPPCQTCLDPTCRNHGKRLGGTRGEYSGHLFTRDRGVIPIRILRPYCKGCKTSYYPNYFVREAKGQRAVREYYPIGLPEYLEVQKTFYVHAPLIDVFRAQMTFAHASGDTCARIYNLSHSPTTPANRRHPLTADHVWNAFYLHALLLDAHHNGFPLEVPHHGEHRDRFNDAMDERNHRFAGIGQPMWAHACDECEKIIPPPIGSEDQGYRRLNACVMDGVTLGHPRCNVQYCTNRLKSPRDRFCEEHKVLEGFCAVQGCEAPVSVDGPPADLDPIDMLLPEDDQADNETGDSQGGDTAPGPSSPSKGRRPKLRTCLTRRWTHNEQLIVCCCGIVIARSTFFEAESMSNAVAMLKATFPPNLPRAAKSFCFFDNNCNLLRHMLANDITGFDHTCFAVDVFHASVKHKDTDKLCARHCNPAAFPELRNDKGEWVFNTSVAEQTNAWFGAFLPIVREMTEIRHNFFLDEMLKIRNEYQAGILRARRANPRLVPLAELQLPYDSA